MRAKATKEEPSPARPLALLLAALCGCHADGAVVTPALADLTIPTPTDLGLSDDLSPLPADLATPRDLLPAPPSCGDTGGLQRGAPWPMEGYCPTHLGRSPFRGPRVPRIRWSFQTSGGGQLYGTPAIAADGTIYVGGFAGGGSSVFAIEPVGGRMKWVSPAGTGAVGSIAIASDGTVFAGRTGLDPATGAVRRMGKPLGTPLGPALGGDGTHVMATGKSLDAMFADRDALRWSVPAETYLAAPAIGPRGDVYFASSEITPQVRAFDPKSGQVRWSRPLQPASPGPIATVAVGRNGAVYVGTRGGNFYALDGASGAVLWVVPGTVAANTRPAIAADGGVVVGFEDEKTLSALSPDTGKALWSFRASEAFMASPTIDADGTVYIGNLDKHLHAVDGATGALRWSQDVAGSIHTAPSIGSDGTLYFVDSAGILYAVGT